MACLLDRIELVDIEGRRVQVDLVLECPEVPLDSAALSATDWNFLTIVREMFEDHRTRKVPEREVAE